MKKNIGIFSVFISTLVGYFVVGGLFVIISMGYAFLTGNSITLPFGVLQIIGSKSSAGDSSVQLFFTGALFMIGVAIALLASCIYIIKTRRKNE